VRGGLEFLKEVNQGGRPDIGRTVVVIGGGNTAVDCARTASRLGAHATILYRRSRAEMPAIDQEVEEAEREGVEFVFLAAPIGFAREGGKLHHVACVPMRLGDPDESGRRRPLPIDGERFWLPADTVLTAIGEQIDATALPAGLERREPGVRVTRLGKTSRAAVFAGGDVTDGPRSVADALGAGKRAAIGIDGYLRRSVDTLSDRIRELGYGPDGNVSMTRWHGDDPIQRVAPVNEVIAYEDLNTRHFERRQRHPDGWVDSDAWSRFVEVNLGLDATAALAEARRCFNCGVCIECDLCLIFCPDVAISHRANGDGYHIALEYCKGCGLCVEECPRGAMIMVREAR
jgi:NADPH-dependent glutamate synthase beta subunit-like oxidoreductase